MPRKPSRSGSKRARAPATRLTPFEALNVGLGDKIRVERRFVVDGQMTCVADKGVFHGVQTMGSIEHLLLETQGEVRLIPLQTVSEIVLEGLLAKRQAAVGPGAFDPSFA